MKTALKLSEVIKVNAPCIIKNYFGEFEHFKKMSIADYFRNAINHYFDDCQGIDFDWSTAECFKYLNSLIANGPKIMEKFIRAEQAIKQEACVIADFKSAKARWEESGV